MLLTVQYIGRKINQKRMMYIPTDYWDDSTWLEFTLITNEKLWDCLKY